MSVRIHGWGYPEIRKPGDRRYKRKYHYFARGHRLSLCGRWQIDGIGRFFSKDHDMLPFVLCAACVKKLAAIEKAESKS